ncbi:unnamed protein product, partial [Prorocentrum cordatum]
MAAARRAETDRRLQSLEERQAITEDRLARVAGQARLAHGEAAQYRELREAVPDAIGKDLATHLSVPWPLPALDAAVPAGGFSAETSWVRSVLEELRQQGTVKAVYSQSRWDDAAQNRVRIPGVFRVKLRFGASSLGVQQAVAALDHPLRRASGLPVVGVAPMA